MESDSAWLKVEMIESIPVARREVLLVALSVLMGLVLAVRGETACFPPSESLVAWWPLEDSGLDLSGTSEMTLNSGSTYVVAKVGRGVLLNGSNNFGQAQARPDLDIGSGDGLSVEAWIKPSNAGQLADIVEWNNGIGGIGVHISCSTTGTRDLYANLVDTDGVSHQVFSASGLLQDNTFQHIALTYEKDTGVATLYWNGGQVAQSALGSFTPQTGFEFFIGTRRSGPFQGIWFAGVIDELSLHRRALSASEILGIYTAGSAGKCNTPLPLAILEHPKDVSVAQNGAATFSVRAQGTSPLHFQWLFDGSVLSGATQFALSLANVQAQQAGLYEAIVSDASGSITSSPARLTVILPLAILAPPRNVMTVVGGAATFSVVAQSSQPLTYQWLFEGALLAGASTTSLSLDDVHAGQAGRYAAVVSDSTHSVTSAPAVLTVLASRNPVITEFMAENDGSMADEDGESSDWIEIFNPGPSSVSLLGWNLTDQPGRLDKWRFPDTNLAANAYLTVFASEKNRIVPGAPLHTNFRLDADGEYLALVAPDGLTIASEFAPTFPKQRANVSFGLAAGFAYFLEPTPSQPNNAGVRGFVADTKLSTNRGFFFAPVDVKIESATPGATIVYTTNGDEPTATTGVRIPPLSPALPPEANLRLTTTTTLRAAAFKDGYVPTDVDTHTYVFPGSVANQTRPAGASTTWVDDPPGNGQSYPADFILNASVINNALPGYSFTNALLSIPTLSVVTPLDGLFGQQNGIYPHAFMTGTNWERRASIELIYPDGREGFHLDAGLRMHGAVSRLNAVIPKHPLRMIFRREYGAAELDFPLFPGSDVRRFDHLVLRACSTDAWPIADVLDFLWRSKDATYQRDQWMRDAQLAMGHPSARGIYVQLYLNGLYWGLYNLTERMSDAFCASHLGGERTDYDVVTDFTGEAVAGTRDSWTQLLQLADRAPTDPNALWQMQGLNPDGTRNSNLPVLIHLDNFIDYIALHIYAAAIDWPGRNWWAARRRGAESEGFRFFVWDQEIALDRLDRVGTWGNAPANIEAVYEPDTPAQLYNGLRRDPEFRVRFADRLQKHLFSGGVLTIQSNIARWSTRAAEIDRAIVGESARWGDAHHTPSYTRQTDWLRMSNFTQNTYWAANLPRAWTRFKNVGLYPDLTPPGFSHPGGSVPDGFALTMTHSNAQGGIFFTVDGTDPRRRGGTVAPTALPYSHPLQFVSPTLVRARVMTGGSWSALVEARFYPPQDLRSLQLSELMYNPPRFGAVDGDEVEFVELYNAGALPIDLSGVRFTKGIVFTFPARTVLSPGAFFVLIRNPLHFSTKYPGAAWQGIYTGKLDNDGEQLELSDPFGGVVFSITYDDAAPWPAEANDSELSLQRMNFTNSMTNLTAWVAAPPTPGAALPPGLMDQDGDGMPDQWEADHDLSPGIADGGEDADHDGLANYQEFVAGTDPRDSDDYLRFKSVQASRDGPATLVSLTFMARSNKTYSVQYADPVSTVSSAGWTTLEEWSATPTDRLTTVTDILSSSVATRFYRLVTPRLP